MTPLEIIGICIVCWLYMARMSMRWEHELYDVQFNLIGVALNLTLWWIMLPLLLEARLKKTHRQMTDRGVRLLIGESRWHKKERLENEHKSRARELEMPES